MIVQNIRYRPEKALKALEPCIRNPDADIPFSEFLERCLSGFEDFVPVFMGSGFERHISTLKINNPLPKEYYQLLGDDPDICATVNPREANKPRSHWKASSDLRPEDEYPLDEKELQEAGKYLVQNPIFLDSVASFQLCLMAYFDTILGNLANENYIDYFNTTEMIKFLHDPVTYKGNSQPRVNKFEAKLAKISKETQSFSFLRDLAPIMATFMSEYGSETSDFYRARALRDSFTIGAFSSSDADSKKKQRCPFADFITEMANRDYIKGEAGRYTLRERPRHGAFLGMLGRHLQQSPLYQSLQQAALPERMPETA